MRKRLVASALLLSVSFSYCRNMSYDKLYAALERKIESGKSLSFFLRKHHLLRDINLDKQFSSGSTPLTLALTSGNLEAAGALVRYGANVRVTNKMGVVPMDRAVHDGHESLVKSMVDHGGVLTSREQSFMDSLVPQSGPLSNEELLSCLQQKISLGHLTSRFFCCNCQMRGDMLNRPFSSGPYKGFTPLTMALQLNRSVSIELLMKNGADANQKDTFGTLPLMFAVDRAWLETVRLLLDHGAVFTPEICIVLPNRMGTFYYLLKYQCFDQECLNWMLLGARNHYDIILLLKHSADIHYKNEYGTSAIDNAVRRCDRRSVQILYNYGANLSDIKQETLDFLDSECMTSRCNLGIDGERRCLKTRCFLREHGL